MSLRARLALLVAVAVGVAVALAALAAFVTVRVELRHQFDKSLVARAEAAVDSPLADPALLVRVPPATFGAADLRVALVRADGQVFAADQASAALAGPRELAVARGEAPRSIRSASDLRIVALPVGRGFALVIGRSLAETQRVLSTMGVVLLVVGLVGIVVAASAGLAIARAGLRPVDRLTEAAEHVARTEELTPIEVRGDDELARLARSFNTMLGALAESRERQRRLVADAGHELRTPLTSLRTNLELLSASDAGRPLPPGDRVALLDDVRAQVAELTDLVGDLVELARDEPTEEPPRPVEFADVVSRAVERARRRAVGVAFDVRLDPWTVVGQPRLLERAVTNVLDNAVKWSPPNGTVTVTLISGELRVADEGPGVAETDRPHVFDRFYRAADARSLPGSGLGLAIVRQAAERHGGSVDVEQAYGGGALFTLRVPGTVGSSAVLT